MLFHLLYFFLNVTSPENWYTDPGSPPGGSKEQTKCLLAHYFWYTDPNFGIGIPYLVYGSRIWYTDPVFGIRIPGSRIGIPIPNGVATRYTDPKRGPNSRNLVYRSQNTCPRGLVSLRLAVACMPIGPAACCLLPAFLLLF